MISDSETPIVSVVMAVHNVGGYLEEAVDSILAQTLRDFEFIIVDDGSSDGSGAWLEEKALEDARIRLVRQENAGLTPSLNRGVALARGEFIARMDGDDIADPERLGRQVEFLRSRPDVVCCGTFVIYVDHKGRPLFRRKLPCSHEEIERCHLGDWGGFIVHPTAMVRKRALEEARGYDESFLKTQDYDLWMRLARIGKLANIPEYLLKYRYHSAGITQAKAGEQQLFRRQVLERELKIRQLGGPLEVPHEYQIFPGDLIWLAKAAAESGLMKTTSRLVYHLLKPHFHDIGGILALLNESFKNRRIGSEGHQDHR